MVYGRLAAELGITHREVGRMRVVEVARQLRYWARFPTVRDMVAGYLGFTPGPTTGPGPQTEEEFRRAFLNHGAVTHG